MSEEDNKAQGQKAKISKLARAAFIVPALLWGIGLILCRLTSGPHLDPVPSSGFRGFLAEISAIFHVAVIPTSIILGAVAIVRIKTSQAKLTGIYLAIGGMFLAIVLMAVTMWHLFEIKAASEMIASYPVGSRW